MAAPSPPLAGPAYLIATTIKRVSRGAKAHSSAYAGVPISGYYGAPVRQFGTSPLLVTATTLNALGTASAPFVTQRTTPLVYNLYQNLG